MGYMELGDELEKALEIMRNEKKAYKDYLPMEAIQEGNRLAGKMAESQKDVRKNIAERIWHEIPYESPHAAVWWYSVLIGMIKDASMFIAFLQYIRKRKDAFSLNTQYFLYSQLNALYFRFPALNSEKGRIELLRFYQEIVNGFAEKISVPLKEIPFRERDENLVIVITEQFLAVNHAPTAMALDRCKILIEKMGKSVLLINSKEMLTSVGEIPFYKSVRGSFVPKYDFETEFNWQGATIPYYQCKMPMPDLWEIEQLLKEVRNMAPGWAVVIGKGGVLGNLVGRMVPSISIAMISSILCVCSKYQALNRKMTEEDTRILNQVGYPKGNVIESTCTFSKPEQKEFITREELKIPKDAFLAAVVGNRLDEEVADDFLEMLEEAVSENMRIGFIGVFQKYERRIERFPKVRERSFYLGYCEDLLSRMELCDLYVNPMRLGGGSSSVFAMLKGVPVVTLDYGDVSINAGKEFCVKDYKEMRKKIQRYCTDAEFRETMSGKARKRAGMYLDGGMEFVGIMQEAERRENARRCK